MTGHYNMSRLNMVVVLSTVESTLPALRKAGVLANNLGAPVTLLVPQVVLHPLPETPPALVEFKGMAISAHSVQVPSEDHGADLARKLRRASHKVIFRETE